MLEINNGTMGMQPDSVQYQTSNLTENSNSQNNLPEEDKIFGTSKVVVGDSVFKDVPVTFTMANNTIRSVSVSLSSGYSNSNIVQQDIEGIKKVVTLHYKMMDISKYNQLYDNINKNVNVLIQNETIEDRFDGVTLNPAIDGEYKLINLKYKSTVDDQYHDVTVKLSKSEIYSREDWDMTEDIESSISRSRIFEDFNPLESTIDVFVYINDWLLFEGELADVTTNSLKALGKERSLADSKVDIIKYDTSLDSLLREVLNWRTGYGIEGSLNAAGMDIEIIDTSRWDIIERACSDVGAKFFVDNDMVFINKPFGNNYGGTQIDNNLIKTSFNFKASKKYNSIIVSGNFRFIWYPLSGHDTVPIKCYNRMLIAGRGMDYSKMEMVDANSPSSDSPSFECFVDINDNFYDITASEQSFNFIESTLPDKTYDYWGSIVIEMPVELVAKGYFPNDYITNGKYPYSVQGDFLTWDENVFEGVAELEVFPEPSYSVRTNGIFYLHIFADNLDELAMFTVNINDVKLVDEDLYDGYRIFLSGSNRYSHSFNYIQSTDGLTNLATDILNKANSELKVVRFECKGMIDVYPGSKVNYGGKTFFVEKVQIKVDKDKSIKTIIDSYEFKVGYYSSDLHGGIQRP